MKFHVGDIVKIKDYENGQFPDTLWVEDMRCMAGKEVEIIDIPNGLPQPQLRVSFYNNGENREWYIYQDDVEKIVMRNIHNFTKRSLKSGMIVEYRDGTKGLFVKKLGAFLGCDGYTNLCEYNIDLTSADHFKELDIMKVYEIKTLDSLETLFNDNDNIFIELIWEREEVKKMTLKEVESELGYKIELIRG